MKPAPLIKIASGGELSRFALAAKTVLLRKFGVPTMIFDEIDTGVGGVTAQKMAEKWLSLPNSGRSYALPTWPRLPALPISICILPKQ